MLNLCDEGIGDGAGEEVKESKKKAQRKYFLFFYLYVLKSEQYRQKDNHQSNI